MASVRDNILTAVLSAGLGASWALRAWIEDTQWTECFWMFVGLSVAAFFVLRGAYWWLERQQRPMQRGRIMPKTWIACTSVLLASYVIMFLLNFPGCYSMDSIDSVNIALGNEPLTNAHPVFYTLMVSPFVHLGVSMGEIQNGLGVFVILQLIVCAVVYGYTCAWLQRSGAPLFAVAGALAFFAFDPVIGRYAITMWKDIPFSLCILLLVLMLFDIARDHGASLKRPSVMIGLAVLSVIICLMRNNGLYAMLLTVFVLVIAYRRQIVRLIPVIVSIPLILVITGPVYTAAGIPASPFRESVGIPLQQISGTVASGEQLTDEQYAQLSNLVNVENMAALYDQTSTNPVKYDPTFSNEWLDAHKAEFISLWWSIAQDHPEQYMKAYLRITQGYWNIETYSWVVSTSGLGDGNGRNILYELTGSELVGGNVDTQYTQLRENTPLRPLYSLALSAWLCLALCVFRLRCCAGELAIPYMPLVAIWATMLIAAPYYCEFRYMFALHIALPVVIIMAFFTFAENAPAQPTQQIPVPRMERTEEFTPVRGSHSARRVPTPRS